MIAIIDNDFVSKLARIELLNAFHAVMSKRKIVPHLQPSIDGTFDLAKRGALRKLATEAQRDSLAAFAAKAKRVSLDDCGIGLVETCHLVEGIDPGDAIWLSAGACNAQSIVFTSDKNALRAVANTPSCKEIADRLAGRVCCLEQFVLEQFEDLGYAMVRKGIIADPGADGALTNSVPSLATKRAEAEPALRHYIDRLRTETGALLKG